MKDVIVFILLGFGPAALIAMLAIALVVQFRGSGVINLAAGAIATLGAYAFYTLTVEQGWATGPAFVGGLVISALFGVILDQGVFRVLRTASPLAKLAASLGILLALQSFFIIQFGPNGKSAPALLPDTSSVTVFDTPIPASRLYLVAIVIVVAVVLTVVYRRTRLGLATTASAQNENAAMLLGLSPQRMSLANTLIASVLAGGFGMLVASQVPLDASSMSLAVIPALGAALLGGFTSIGIAAAAGMGIGILQTVLIYLQTKAWFPTVGGGQLPGVSPLLAFAVIVGALWFRGQRLPTRGQLTDQRLPSAPEASRIAAPTAAVLVIGVICLLTFPPEFRQGLLNTLVGVVLCLSLVVVVGYVGQISLMQTALAGCSAFAVQKLTVEAGIPFPFSPILAVIVAIGIGLVAALPSLRVRGVNLAIVTLAAAVALEQFVFNNVTFGQDAQGSPLPSPTLFGLNLGADAGFPGWDGSLPSPVPGLECLVIAILVAVGVASLRRTAFGQHMLAVRANEAAAAAAGANVRGVKLVGFAIAAGIAGIAGVMSAYSLGAVNAADYGLTVALGLVAFAYLGGITTIFGAVLAGFYVPGGLSAVALQKWTGLGGDWLNLIGGVLLILYVMYYPQGMAIYTVEWWRRMRAKYGSSTAGSRPVEPDGAGVA